MRRRVESAGPAWRCGAGGPWSFLDGHDGGADRVGSRLVVWARLGPTELRVAHDGAASVLDIIRGAVPAVEKYAVRLTTAKSGAAGVRVWWVCPSCGRRAGKLYLPPARPRLACRTCCRLLYNSQFRR